MTNTCFIWKVGAGAGPQGTGCTVTVRINYSNWFALSLPLIEIERVRSTATSKLSWTNVRADLRANVKANVRDVV